jgi:PqqD family protein of HPr-rel-A system
LLSHADPLNLAPAHAPSVATAVLDDEAVLYDERDGAVHVLNATATVVWNCLDGETPVSAIISELAHAFAVDEATMQAHVVGMVEDLASKDLLTGIAT